MPSRHTNPPLRPEPLVRRPDLNVTPLIDILLVLLVIFMAALPLTQEGTDVTLPQRAAAGEPPPGRIVVTLDADRSLAVNHHPVAAADLQGFLAELFRPRRDKTLYIKGSGHLRYGEVVKVIDAARGAGVQRVGIITQGS